MRHAHPLLPFPALLAFACGSPEPKPEDVQSEAEAQLDEEEEVAQDAPAFPTRPLFGDTHLHTSFSFDAGTFGARLEPADAYRFAKGQEVTATVSGLPAKLSRPLDFLVVADHSENLGFFRALKDGDERVMANEYGRKWHEAVVAGGQASVDASIEIIKMFSQGQFPEELTLSPEQTRPMWQEVIQAAEDANDPGRFTAFIGYEWTSMPSSQNLHRVVIFKDGGDKAGQVVPFSADISDDPEKLWDAMDAYEDRIGGRVLAIPHNGNLSNGLMFALTTQEGRSFDADYARRRMQHEPLYEVTQIKGDGEAHPFLSPNDEFADYETWDVGNLDASIKKTDDMLAGEYAREALKTGLRLQTELGANPFAFGMIGSTDSHTALATADSDNFFGKHSGVEPSAVRASHQVISGEAGELYGWQMTASGYAAVWAHQNTRASIFEAMERKETYATTGPRMVVRFFGGWDFSEEDSAGDVAEVGYDRGVPMGGTLAAPGDGQAAPTFLVSVLKDPEGANLDRAQVVKGWVDAEGKTHEKVYDVVWSGDRVPGEDGKVGPVGSTVDEAKATYENTIGAPQLTRTWTDPDFDPARPAFYYVRVLQIPTPRWTAYDRVRFDAKVPDGVPMSTQERAYTSPIWYTPNEGSP